METDTIDLTTPSPEPEQQPRLPVQQSRGPANIKAEPQNDSSGASRDQIERHAPEVKFVGTQQRPPQIHPQHLALIIDTTSPKALKAVLLTLCKTSPALSGALARGLAPHSTYAQGLMRQYRQKKQAAASRSVKTEDPDQAAYERMKQRLQAKHSTRTSSLNRGPSTPTAESSRPRHEDALSLPRVKREAYPVIGRHGSDSDSTIPGSFPRSAHRPKPTRADTDSDSDSDSFIPSSFSHSAQQVKSTQPAQRGSSNSGSFFREQTLKPLPEKSACAQNGPRIKTEREKCTLCKETIVDQFETCLSHPSSEVNDDDLLTCCNQPAWALGCVTGLHVTESEAKLSRNNLAGPLV